MVTTRLLKAVLPAACLWTGLREVEGFGYEDTLKELKTIFPPDPETMDDDDEDGLLPSSVPDAIRTMADSQTAVEALGSMMWWVLSLRN